MIYGFRSIFISGYRFSDQITSFIKVCGNFARFVTTTTSSVVSDDRADIMTTLDFQWLLLPDMVGTTHSAITTIRDVCANICQVIAGPYDTRDINICTRQCNRSWYTSHDDVIKWKHFPRYCPFVRGIHRSPVNSPHKGQWRGALMFSFICVWIIGWVNNRETGDMRRYRAHCDVSVMTGLDLLGLNKITENSPATFPNAFSLMKKLIFWLKFHWSLFLWVRMTLVQVMAWHRTGHKPLSEPMMAKFHDPI